MKTRRADLTIVTICKDNPSELYATLESIRSQSCPPRRSLVVDGSSENIKPKTQAIATQAGSSYFWEPASGIYAAMRFTLDKLEQANYCLFLNSGDRLAGPTALCAFIEAIEAEENLQPAWILGDIDISRGRKTEDTYRVPRGKATFSSKIRSGDFTLPHPATFYRVDAFLPVNPFGDPYKISADYSTGLRLFQIHGAPAVIPYTISVHELGGISSQTVVRGRLENVVARLRVFGVGQLPLEISWLVKSGAKWLAKAIRRMLSR